MLSNVSDDIKNIIFICDGGIGKNISSTAVVRAIKKKYPKKNIIVLAGCPEIYMHNPNVKRVFNFNNPIYFYEDFVNDESMVVKVEPYFHYDYINKKKNVVECWCEMLEIECDGIEPDIYFNPSELDAAKLFAQEIAQGKELVLLQWVGGKVPAQPNDDKAFKIALAEMFKRAMPKDQAQAITNYLTNKRKAVVVNIAHPNFPPIGNCKTPAFPIRVLLSLLNEASFFIGIDSFLQHAAAARQINKKGIVIWGGTSKTCLGYDIHENLEIEACPTPACHRPNSFLFDLHSNGTIWECPHGEPCMKRDIKDIVNVVNQFKQMKIEKGAKDEKVNVESNDCGCA